jgi:hypothetical protein
MTGGIFSHFAIDPIGDAATIVAVAGTFAAGDFRVVAPFLRARAGVERDHLVEGRAQDQAVLDEQRRCLELRPRGRLARTVHEIAGVKLPGSEERIDIGRRDLVERREARPALIAAPIFPAERR